MEKDNRMTVKQAADFLDVHTNTIYDWLRDGKLRADKEGKSYKINHMDVFNLHLSKTKVDEDKQVLVGAQTVKDESYKMLAIMSSVLIRSTFNTCCEEYAKYHNNSNKLMMELNDKHEKEEITLEELSTEQKKIYKYLDDLIIGLLLKARENIESFYSMYDFMENLDKFYKHKEKEKNTLDEELQSTQEFRKSLEDEDYVTPLHKAMASAQYHNPFDIFKK